MRWLVSRRFWIGFAVAALLVEFYVRMRVDSTEPLHLAPLPALTRAAADPAIGVELVPSTKLTVTLDRQGAFAPFPVEYAIGADGFRGEVTRTKPPDTLRIAIVGDAAVFGVGVAEDETFAKVLETSLAPLARGRRVEVLNAGAPSRSLEQSLAACRARLFDFEPDAVIATLSARDIVAATPQVWTSDAHATWLARLGLGDDVPTDQLQFSAHGVWFARRVSRIVDQLGFQLEDWLRSRAWHDVLDHHWGVAESPAWKAFSRELEVFVGDCNAHHAEAHVLFLPDLTSLRDYTWKDRHAALASLALTLGITFHDPLAALERHSGEALIVSLDRPYPSAAAHARIGEFLAKELSSAQLVRR